MSQEIDLPKDSGDDDGEWPNTASAPPLSLSRKRPRHEHVGSEDAQVLLEHHESHEGLAAAASQPMTLDSELKSRNDGSAKKCSQKLMTLKLPSKSSGQHGRDSVWKNRLSELAEYRKLHGHCNVPDKYSKNAKLANWVGTQRGNYMLRNEGKTSPMTLSRIQELESLGFEWRVCIAAWEDRLSELADYRKIHGHCNVPTNYSENNKLAKWVTYQRTNYRLLKEGKTSPMTLSRIQELESLGFEWGVCATVWKDRLSELADYHKIHGHCNVPRNYSENTKLGLWVTNQKKQYRLHKEGKTSSMTLFRIQALESLGFESGVCITVWEDRLIQLADYHKIHGHCIVPRNYSENNKLGCWVTNQKSQYRLLKEGKTSSMTLSRIQELECLGFEWKARIGRTTRNPKKRSLDDDMTRVCERAVEAPEHVQTMVQAQEDLSGREICRVAIKSTSPLSPKNPTGMAKSNFAYIPGRTEEV
jgi:hypothetical protein